MESLDIEIGPDPVPCTVLLKRSEGPSDVHASVGVDVDGPSNTGTKLEWRLGQLGRVSGAYGGCLRVERAANATAGGVSSG